MILHTSANLCNQVWLWLGGGKEFKLETWQKLTYVFQVSNICKNAESNQQIFVNVNQNFKGKLQFGPKKNFCSSSCLLGTLRTPASSSWLSQYPAKPSQLFRSKADRPSWATNCHCKRSFSPVWILTMVNEAGSVHPTPDQCSNTGWEPFLTTSKAGSQTLAQGTQLRSSGIRWFAFLC